MDKNSKVVAPLVLMVEAFYEYYINQPHHPIPQSEKDSSYWSEAWREFLKVQPFDTFIPYLFWSGCLHLSLWLTFKKEGNKPFHDIDKAAGYPMDWLDTALIQPYFVLKYEHLDKEGCDLKSFINHIYGTFDGCKLDETKQEGYWQDRYSYTQDQEKELFEYMAINTCDALDTIPTVRAIIRKFLDHPVWDEAEEVRGDKHAYKEFLYLGWEKHLESMPTKRVLQALKEVGEDIDFEYNSIKINPDDLWKVTNHTIFDSTLDLGLFWCIGIICDGEWTSEWGGHSFEGSKHEICNRMIDLSQRMSDKNYKRKPTSVTSPARLKPVEVVEPVKMVTSIAFVPTDAPIAGVLGKSDKPWLIK